MHNKEYEFTLDLEATVTYSIQPGCKGSSVLSYYGPTPDDPAEIEDLLIEITFAGKTIDITEIFNRAQTAAIEEQCFQNAED